MFVCSYRGQGTISRDAPQAPSTLSFEIGPGWPDSPLGQAGCLVSPKVSACPCISGLDNGRVPLCLAFLCVFQRPSSSSQACESDTFPTENSSRAEVCILNVSQRYKC